MTVLRSDKAAAQARKKAMRLFEDAPRIREDKLGDRRGAITEMERALALSEAAKDKEGIGAALLGPTDLHDGGGNRAKAQECFARVASMRGLPSHLRNQIEIISLTYTGSETDDGLRAPPFLSGSEPGGTVTHGRGRSGRYGFTVADVDPAVPMVETIETRPLGRRWRRRITLAAVEGGTAGTERLGIERGLPFRLDLPVVEAVAIRRDAAIRRWLATPEDLREPFPDNAKAPKLRSI